MVTCAKSRKIAFSRAAELSHLLKIFHRSCGRFPRFRRVARRRKRAFEANPITNLLGPPLDARLLAHVHRTQLLQGLLQDYRNPEPTVTLPSYRNPNLTLATTFFSMRCLRLFDDVLQITKVREILHRPRCTFPRFARVARRAKSASHLAVTTESDEEDAATVGAPSEATPESSPLLGSSAGSIVTTMIYRTLTVALTTIPLRSVLQ